MWKKGFLVLVVLLKNIYGRVDWSRLKPLLQFGRGYVGKIMMVCVSGGSSPTRYNVINVR